MNHVAMSVEELSARLTLLATPGIPVRTGLRMFLEHGTAVAALRALRNTPLADAVASEAVRERVHRALRSIERQDVIVVGYDDARYPDRLRNRLADQAPLLLFAFGDVSLMSRRGVAVVGTRRPTQYGLDMAEQIGAGLARGGAVVISGLAAGIDGAAHAAALAEDGTTIAITGCGVDVYYPHEHEALQDRIAAHGLLISEFLPGEPPKAKNFPWRNRIIAALSEGVVVVEAGLKSGAVRTANHAAQFGLDVWGVPNLFDHENFEGVLDLLKDGAHTYIGMHDLLYQTGFCALEAEPAPDTSEKVEEPRVEPRFMAVWNAIGREATHVDRIASGAGITSTAALVLLFELELNGRVRQLAGQRFAKVLPKKRRETIDTQAPA